MGVEVQLFYAKLKTPIVFNRLNAILQKLGCKKRPSYEDEQNYEIFSNKGIIELQVMGISEKIKKVYIRFSFGNPITVINQTFNLFEKLSKIVPIEVYASGTMDRIMLTDQSFSNLKKQIAGRKKDFDKHFMKIDKPIRGGKETFDYREI